MLLAISNHLEKLSMDYKGEILLRRPVAFGNVLRQLLKIDDQNKFVQIPQTDGGNVARDA